MFEFRLGPPVRLKPSVYPVVFPLQGFDVLTPFGGGTNQVFELDPRHNQIINKGKDFKVFIIA